MKIGTRDIAAGEHFVEQRGVRLSYRISGIGPLLIVQGPGWGLGAEYLRNGLKPLETQFTLLFYDTRGNGRSSRPDDATKMGTTEMVDDLESLRQYFGIDKIWLLGHSHGGDISLGYAIRYPDRVEKLILVDSGINDFDAGAMIGLQLKERAGDPRFSGAITALQSNEPPKSDVEFGKRLRARLPLFFYDPDAHLASFERDTPILPSAWANRTFDAAEALDSLPQDAAMDQIRANTLILVGQNDWVCPPAIAQRIHHAILNSEIEIFEQTGHFPWIERPEQFFTSVTAFLGTAPGS